MSLRFSNIYFRSVSAGLHLVLATLVVGATVYGGARPQYRTRSLAAENDPNNPNPAPTTVNNYPPSQQSQSIGANPREAKDNFNPYEQLYSIGIEGPAFSGTSVFKESAVSLGYWVNDTFGIEVYFGYSKNDDSYSAQTITSVANNLSTPVQSTANTTYSGAQNPKTFLFGGAAKYRVYQAKYFGVSADFLATLTPGQSVSYQTGIHAVTTPDIGNPSTYNVADSNLGTVASTTDAFFRFGPRMTLDYHLPFLTNLVLGTTIGVYVSVGGKNTTTTTTTSQQYSVQSGAQQAPTVQSSSTSTTVADPGGNSNTYALGGTGLNIGNAGGLTPLSVVGTFRIRYSF